MRLPETSSSVHVRQASSYGARKVLGTLPAAATSSIVKIVKQDSVNRHPDVLSQLSYIMLYQHSRVCAGKVPAEATLPTSPAT